MSRKNAEKVRKGKIGWLKRQASTAGAPVENEDLGVRAYPDGTVDPIGDPVRAVAAAEAFREGDGGLGLNEAAGPDMERLTDYEKEMAQASAPPPDHPPPPAATAPETMFGFFRACEVAGIDEAEAQARWNAKQSGFPHGSPPTPGNPQEGRGTPGSQIEQMGPDPEAVAAYQAKMVDYVPPVLEKTYEVTLQVRHAEYVHLFAAWYSQQRGVEIAMEKMIEIMVREHYRDHAGDRDFLMAARDGRALATGAADDFNPAAGQWGG